MPLERQFRDKYSIRSPERICCPNSVRLVTKKKVFFVFAYVMKNYDCFGRMRQIQVNHCAIGKTKSSAIDFMNAVFTNVVCAVYVKTLYATYTNIVHAN